MAYQPRLNSDDIQGNFHWYSENPFYLANYGMPNCTCYAWGRFWEIGDPLSQHINKPVNLPTSDGGQWWGQAVASGYYQIGQTPQLGAVICFDRPGESGHVAIVEEIGQINGRDIIVTSNSAWQSTFFYTQTLYADQNYGWSSYNFQGFIYNPFAEPIPQETTKRKNFKWVLYANKIRARNNLRNML